MTKARAIRFKPRRPDESLVVDPGTQPFALARQLQRLGCLCRFWTSFTYLATVRWGAVRNAIRGMHGTVGWTFSVRSNMPLLLMACRITYGPSLCRGRQ